jgi:hypothetical protein
MCRGSATASVKMTSDLMSGLPGLLAQKLVVQTGSSADSVLALTNALDRITWWNHASLNHVLLMEAGLNGWRCHVMFLVVMEQRDVLGSVTIQLQYLPAMNVLERESIYFPDVILSHALSMEDGANGKSGSCAISHAETPQSNGNASVTIRSLRTVAENAILKASWRRKSVFKKPV